MIKDDIAYRCTQAMRAAAEAKSLSDRLEKMTKRVYSQLIIACQGSVAYREHAARCDPKYTAAEDAYIDAATKANVLGAEADGLKLQFEYWRTAQADRRAEMNLR